MIFNILGKQFDYPIQLTPITQKALTNKFTGVKSFLPIWQKIYEVSTNKIAYDIGAHYGIYSLVFKTLGFDVLAFEPSNRVQDVLSHIINPKNIHKIALSNKHAELDSFFNDCPIRGTPYITQKILFTRLDDYMDANNIPTPDFVKIDIEGMESLALHGMKKLISKRPIFQIEYHKGLQFKGMNYPGFVPVESGGFDFNEFDKQDFIIYDKCMATQKPQQLRGNENYFFVPLEKNFNIKQRLFL